MLKEQGFDLWADGYDLDVQLTEEADDYPFAGYKNVLGNIYRCIRQSKGRRILDLGCGTGTLSKKLYDDGYAVCGVDFSPKMLQIAQQKMPDATFIRHDFSKGLPVCLQHSCFDFIVCTYAIHHLTDAEKIHLLHALQPCLAPGGSIFIGDVAFATADSLSQCRAACGELWDDDEIYPVWETLQKAFPALQFEQISFCAGILRLQK